MKLQAFKPATLLKRDSNTGAFLCILRIFFYFEKYLRTTASNYSFTLLIYYLLLAVSLQLQRCHLKCHFK